MILNKFNPLHGKDFGSKGFNIATFNFDFKG